MWIITHDHVHEDGKNPSLRVPQSKDFLLHVTRKKAKSRRHVFRLLSRGREMFRGVAYFENDAPFKEILRPLDEFGRSLHDCDEIRYMARRLEDAPTGRAVWNTIHEDGGRRIDQMIADGAIGNMGVLLEEWGADSTCELAAPDVREILAKYDE